MRRTPLQRKTPMRSTSTLARSSAQEPRERPPAPPMDLGAAREALARQAASLAAPPREHAPVPDPVHTPKPRPQGFPSVVRQTILDRDHYACVRCGAPIDTGHIGYSLQHRDNRAMGGTLDPRTNQPGNGIVACGSGTTGCHGWMEANPTEAERCGYAVASWADATTVPVLTMRDGWVKLDHKGNRWRCPAPDGGDAHAAAQRKEAWK